MHEMPGIQSVDAKSQQAAHSPTFSVRERPREDFNDRLHSRDSVATNTSNVTATTLEYENSDRNGAMTDLTRAQLLQSEINDLFNQVKDINQQVRNDVEEFCLIYEQKPM